MIAELIFALSIVGNLKIVKPAATPPAPVQVEPAMRRFRDLPPPYELIEISEEQYR